MPRMMPLNIQYPDLEKVERIRGQRISNAIRQRALEREPEQWATQQAASDLDLESGNAKYELEKLQDIATRFSGVTDQESYNMAVDQHFRAYPDEIGALRQIPTQYDPDFVKRVVQISGAKAQEIGKLYETEEGWQTAAGAVGKKKPRSTTGSDVKTWLTPNGKIINLMKGEIPPESSVPFKGKGLDIQFDPETGRPVSISQGGMGGKGKVDLGTKAKNDLETKIINASENLTRVQAIKNRYKPEYLQAIPRIKNAFNSLKAKFGGKLDPDEKQYMKGVTEFLRTTIENLNLYVKEITGAQMSAQEAERLSLAQPKPGQSWWDFLWSGDSPPEIESKIDDIDYAMRAAIARFQWYKAKGMSNDAIIDMVNKDAAKDLDEISRRLRERDRLAQEQ